MIETLLSTPEVAEFLGVTPKRLFTMAGKGLRMFPRPVKHPDGRDRKYVYWRLADIEVWKKANKEYQDDNYANFVRDPTCYKERANKKKPHPPE